MSLLLYPMTLTPAVQLWESEHILIWAKLGISIVGGKVYPFHKRTVRIFRPAETPNARQVLVSRADGTMSIEPVLIYEAVLEAEHVYPDAPPP